MQMFLLCRRCFDINVLVSIPQSVPISSYCVLVVKHEQYLIERLRHCCCVVTVPGLAFKSTRSMPVGGKGSRDLEENWRKFPGYIGGKEVEGVRRARWNESG
jgi:hypothetical protein